MRTLTKMTGGAAALGLSLMVGCALTTETIHIEYPAPATVEKVKGAESIQVQVEVLDLRAKATREVARKINAFGAEMAPILNDEDVQLLVKRAVELELKARGYVLEGGGSPPQDRIDHLPAPPQLRLLFW
jgi:uncharacterized lipoprotein YajG